MVDGVGQPATLTFPIPYVDVTEPQRWQTYLPAVANRACEEARVDVALVIDTSVSMRETQPGGGTNLEAAIHAARSFLTYLRLPADRVAVVAFNSDGTLVQELTGDQVAVANALGNLPPGSGTRLDAGLDVAAAELAGPRAVPGHHKAIALLTDGHHGGPVEEAIAAADRARGAGMTLYTVGLGPKADADLLARMVAPGHSFLAPEPSDLRRIYRDIAGVLPCDAQGTSR